MKQKQKEAIFNEGVQKICEARNYIQKANIYLDMRNLLPATFLAAKVLDDGTAFNEFLVAMKIPQTIENNVLVQFPIITKIKKNEDGTYKIIHKRKYLLLKHTGKNVLETFQSYEKFYDDFNKFILSRNQAFLDEYQDQLEDDLLLKFIMTNKFAIPTKEFKRIRKLEV